MVNFYRNKINYFEKLCFLNFFTDIISDSFLLKYNLENIVILLKTNNSQNKNLYHISPILNIQEFGEWLGIKIEMIYYVKKNNITNTEMVLKTFDKLDLDFMTWSVIHEIFNTLKLFKNLKGVLLLAVHSKRELKKIIKKLFGTGLEPDKYISRDLANNVLSGITVAKNKDILLNSQLTVFYNDMSEAYFNYSMALLLSNYIRMILTTKSFSTIICIKFSLILQLDSIHNYKTKKKI